VQGRHDHADIGNDPGRITYTLTPSGASVGHLQGNAQGVKGVGTTGTVYNVEVDESEATKFVNFGNGAVAATLEEDLRFVSAGSDANFLVHEVAHFTQDANGNVEVNFDKPIDTCVG
jgi:hypothetical protein